jgi:Meiotically up-regulated gene 113
MPRHRPHKTNAARRGMAGELVYFVRAGDAVKIGRTGNLAARLKALATGSAVVLELLAAVPGGARLEARLHRRWRHLRLRGEWFRADEELLRSIREEAGGRPPEQNPRIRADAAQMRRVLAALDRGGLAAAAGTPSWPPPLDPRRRRT